MSAIESVMQEKRIFAPAESMVKAAAISGMAAYHALCREAERHSFWRQPAEDPFRQDHAVPAALDCQG